MIEKADYQRTELGSIIGKTVKSITHDYRAPMARFTVEFTDGMKMSVDHSGMFDSNGYLFDTDSIRYPYERT
jgi:hypothetical protein